MNKKLPISNALRNLEDEIAGLQEEIRLVTKEVDAFEAILRSHLIDLMIEERELFALYKRLKKEKKEKRQLQKQKGKNYKPSRELVLTNTTRQKTNTIEEKEKKRLYRETMLMVHPDKFSMKGDDNEKATEMTSKLIDIYKHQDLDSLQRFHNYIKTNGLNNNMVVTQEKNTLAKEAYLEKEKTQLEAQLKTLKSKYVYTVLKEYRNPNSFIDELRAYYIDRIAKLKKRTRKAFSS